LGDVKLEDTSFVHQFDDIFIEIYTNYDDAAIVGRRRPVMVSQSSWYISIIFDEIVIVVT